MTQDSSIRLATVGTGYFSRFQYAAWDRIPEVKLVGICNRTVAPAQELADQYGVANIFQDFDRMLDEIKPDLVDIITPPITHVSYVKSCVERGIPVICQKPFTPSLAEAKSLVNFISQKNGNVVIHENFRFQPWFLKLKELMQEDFLGDLYQITFALRPGDGQGAKAYLDRQPYFQQMERFLVHETAVHLIDVFRHLFGDIASVYADLRQVNPVIKGEDAGLIIFEFKNGARGLFDGNRSSDHPADNRRLTMGEMCIEGQNGTLKLNGYGQLSFRSHGENEENSIVYDWNDNDYGGDCVFNLQRHVTDHLLGCTEPMNSAAQYLNNLEIVEASYASSQKGSRINLTTSKSNS